MNKQTKKIAGNALYMVIVVGVVLIVWAIAAAAVGTELVMPGIGATFVALGRLLIYAPFWLGLGTTLLRALISFAIALALFFALFFLSTAFEPVRRVVEPLISALRTLPTMAVALLLSVWASGYVAPVILGVTVIMPQLYSAIRARNATVPKDLLDVAAVCGAGRCATFKVLHLPHAAAAFPEAFPSGLSFGIKIVIAAEILMQTADSLGLMMKLSQVYLETAELIAMTLMAVIVSVAIEYGLRLLLKRIFAEYSD